MSVFISICFLLQVLTEGFGQVYSGLVGQTDKDPQYICHFIGKVVFLSLLERLISVFACHHTCQFAYFLGQNGHIGQFAEVTYTIRFNPAVHFFLCFFQCHYSLFLVSIHIVTGPLFRSSTFMSAPNSPVPTSLPRPMLSSWQK